MSKFKCGDKVVRTRHRSRDFEEGKPYTVSGVDYSCHHPVLMIKEKGAYWYDAACFELYREPAQKTFNPKPGDLILVDCKIIYWCVDKSLVEKFNGGVLPEHFKIFGARYNDIGEMIGWRGWTITGWALDHTNTLYNIKEIIPATSNNPVGISQQPQDLSFQVKALELENQMLRKLLRREGVEV